MTVTVPIDLWLWPDEVIEKQLKRLSRLNGLIPPGL